jgi:hypothetical protein
LANPHKDAIRYIIMIHGNADDPVYNAYFWHTGVYDKYYAPLFQLGEYEVFEAKADLPGASIAAGRKTLQTTAPTSPAQPQQEKVTVQEGDSQTLVVRRQLALLPVAAQLSPAQELYVVTNYVNMLGDNNLMVPGQVITINNEILNTLAKQAMQLDQTQLNAWQQYVSN